METEESLLEFDGPSKCLWSKSKENPHFMKPLKDKVTNVADNILELSGWTPLVKLNKIPLSFGLKCNVYAKCEFLNPSGSCKERVAIRMIESAESQGIIKPGWTIIEATSGNTGTGLAAACAVKGYKCIILMNDNSTLASKMNVLKALGAEVIIASNYDYPHPKSNYAVAQRLQKEIPNSLYINQYLNSGNSLSHYDGTGPEILAQLNSKVDMVVVSAGTGGTISGIGRRIKENLPNCQIIGADAVGSVIARPKSLNELNAKMSKVDGIGHFFEPTILDYLVVDKWIKVKDVDTFETSRMVIQEEGILCGESSGTTLFAALQAAKNLEEGQNCVVIFADGIHSYVNKFLDDKWMELNDFKPIENPQNFWWFDKKISDMPLKNPMTITSEATYQEILTIMRTTPIEQIFVFNNSSDEFIGVITLNYIFDKLTSGEIKGSDKVGKTSLVKFEKVGLNTMLGRVTKVLKRYPFAVVVDDSNTSKIERSNVKGLVTKSELLAFITLY